MALRWTRELFRLAWGLASSIAGGIWATSATAQQWGEKAGQPADFPAVESASEDFSDTYNLPMDLNDEPYLLVEFDSGTTLRRPGSRYTFPPGIILVGTLATVALLLLLGRNYKRFLSAPKESGSEDSESEASLESSAHLEGTAALELQQTLHSTLNQVSSELDRVANETEEKKSAAVIGAEKMPKEFAPPTKEVITLLSNVSDQLTAPADALSHAIAAMLGSLSDSQSVAHFDTAREQLQREIQTIKSNFGLQAQLEAATNKLDGMADKQVKGGSPLHDQVTKCAEWLDSLREKHRLILSSAATVSDAAEKLSELLASQQL